MTVCLLFREFYTELNIEYPVDGFHCVSGHTEECRGIC